MENIIIIICFINVCKGFIELILKEELFFKIYLIGCIVNKYFVEIVVIVMVFDNS